MTASKDSPERLCMALALLLGAAAAQDLLLHAGLAGLGIVLVLPALAITVWLWRPGRTEVSLLLVYLGVEALLPVQNGAGRFADWSQHYQVSRLFGGLPAALGNADTVHWTPLFHELSGALLAWSPSYSTYQLTAVVLNVLWLWPARMLIGRYAADPPLRSACCRAHPDGCGHGPLHVAVGVLRLLRDGRTRRRPSGRAS